MAGRPKGTGGQAEELARAEVTRISKCLAGTRHELRDRAMLYLGVGSGMRIGELSQLRVGDIRGADGRLLSRVVLEKHSTKSKRSRTVAISSQALGHVRRYLESRNPAPGDDEALFPSQRSHQRPMTTNHAVAVIKKMLEEAGVENASSHSLRRTHAANLRRNGTDLEIIRRQLGHRSLATTQRYLGVDPIEVAAAVEGLRF